MSAALSAASDCTRDGEDLEGVRRASDRSFEGDEGIYCCCWGRWGDLDGVKRLCRDKVSSSGERLVGVISTSMSDLAGLGGETDLDGEAKGFRLRPGVTAEDGGNLVFVGVLNGFLAGELASLYCDFRFEGVFNPSSLASNLCLELEAPPSDILDFDLAFAALESPPTACHVSYVPAIPGSARISRFVGSRPFLALNAFCHVLSSRRRICSMVACVAGPRAGVDWENEKVVR